MRRIYLIIVNLLIEVLLGPRSAPTGVFPAAQGMASNPQVSD